VRLGGPDVLVAHHLAVHRHRHSAVDHGLDQEIPELLVEQGNHRIQKFTSEGVFVSKWAARGSGDRQFQVPRSLTVASDGSVYVADRENSRIQKFTSEGVFVSQWGTSGTGDGEFDGPRGGAVASDGSVYVADTVNHRIQKFSPEP